MGPREFDESPRVVALSNDCRMSNVPIRAHAVIKFGARMSAVGPI